VRTHYAILRLPEHNPPIVHGNDTVRDHGISSRIQSGRLEVERRERGLRPRLAEGSSLRAGGPRGQGGVTPNVAARVS